MRYPRLRPTAVVLLGLLAASCSTGTFSGRDPETATDVAELKRRVIELQKKAAINEVEIAGLRQKVAELEERLGESSGSAARQRPGREETPALAGSSAAPPPEGSSSRARPLAEASGPIIEELEIVEAPEPPSSRAPSPGSDRRGGDGVGTAPTQPVTPEAQKLYDQGYALHHQGRHLDAEATFQRFLQTYSSTDLGDNALYWIGESRQARGDLRGALSSFRETVARYPEGNKVPDALLKAGQVLEALGDLDGARESYLEVVRRFEDSAAAAAAQSYLERLP